LQAKEEAHKALLKAEKEAKARQRLAEKRRLDIVDSYQRAN